MIVLLLFLHADHLLNIFRYVSYWHIKQFAQRSTNTNHREYWFRYKPDNARSVGTENMFQYKNIHVDQALTTCVLE